MPAVASPPKEASPADSALTNPAVPNLTNSSVAPNFPAILPEINETAPTPVATNKFKAASSLLAPTRLVNSLKVVPAVITLGANKPTVLTAAALAAVPKTSPAAILPASTPAVRSAPIATPRAAAAPPSK